MSVGHKSHRFTSKGSRGADEGIAGVQAYLFFLLKSHIKRLYAEKNNLTEVRLMLYILRLSHHKGDIVIFDWLHF